MTHRLYNATAHIFILIFMAMACLTITATPTLAEQTPSTEHEMQDLLRTLRSQAMILRVDLSAGHDLSDDQFQNFTANIEQINAAHKILVDLFDRRTDTTRNLGSEAADRHAVMLNTYQGVVTELVGLLASVNTKENLTLDLLDGVLSLLSGVFVTPEPMIFGTLPIRSPGYSPGVPTISPPVPPAFQDGDKTVYEADTASVPEAEITKEIAELAESLEWNPVLMYEYVKNNIQTQFYYGVMKGASETLAQKSGNDADQASLLVALFRAAGYPARYVRGAVEFFPGLDQAKEHFGVEDPEQIAVLLQKAGIPNEKLIQAGRVGNFLIEHIWAEVYIPYGPSRGADPRDTYKRWIPLDTTIKPEGYTKTDPIACDLDAGQAGEDYLNQSRPDSFIDFLAGEVESELDANDQPDAVFSDTLQTRTINEERMKILSPTLQFTIKTVTGEYTQLPDELIHKVRFVARADTSDLFDVTLNTYELSNQQITLSFEPETVEDQEIINSFGGLDHTPCYLVRLRPVIRLNGLNIAVGADGLDMGRTFELTAEFISPVGTESVTDTRICGSLAAIGLVAQNAIIPDSVPFDQRDAARLMHEMAVTYIDMWSQNEVDLAGFFGVAKVHTSPFLVTVGGTAKIDYLLSDPHAFTWQGLYMDADLRTIGAVPVSEDDTIETVNDFLDLTALSGSEAEARVFEDVIDIDSISTADLFMLANEGSIPILEINDTNIDTILPTLAVAENIKDDIRNAVNQGQVVRIPESPISMEDWWGIGYVKADPVTHESGWMLAGGIAGGMTVLNPDHIKWDEFMALKMPYTAPPSEDPGDAAYIRYIPLGLEKKHVGQTVDLTLLVSDAWFRPVPDVSVTFEVAKGGGTFPDGDTAITGEDGRATLRFTLGQHTEDNPDYVHNQELPFATQVGLNLISARVPGTVAFLTNLITIPAWPLAADHLTIINNDSGYNDILSFGGFVSVRTEDLYNNPVSNVDVTFTAGNISSPCLDHLLNDDNNPLKFIPSDAACLLHGYPGYENCGQTGALVEMTNAKGMAAAHYILGGVPAAQYEVSASTESLNPVDFTFYTYPIGNCDPEPPYGHDFAYGLLWAQNSAGKSIVAGAPGAVLPLRAYLRLIWEVPSFDEDNLDDEGNPIFIGSTYEVVTDFDGSLVTIAGPGDTCFCQKTGNMYDCDYTLAEGVNNLTANFKATYEIEFDEELVTFSCNETENGTVYGVVSGFIDDQGVPVSEIEVPVNEDNLAHIDTILNVNIGPAQYIPANAYVVIYENNDLIDYISVDISNGRGTAEIARGSGFDETKTYTAGVLINNGHGEPLESETPEAERLLLTPVEEMIRIKIEDQHENGARIMPDEEEGVLAIVTPDNVEVEWSITEEIPDCPEKPLKVEITSQDTESCRVKVDENSGSGYIFIRATDKNNDAIFVEETLPIGCSACTDCEKAGGGFTALSSVNARFSMGITEGGLTAGQIFLRAETITPDLAKPSALFASTMTDGLERIYNDSGLRQVLSDQTLADIVETGDYAYEIRFYRSDVITGQSAGLYDISASADPFVTWAVEGDDNSLTLTEIRDSQARVYEYGYSNNNWSLDRGNGLSTTTRTTNVDPDTGDRIVTETIEDGSQSPSRITQSTWHTFAWGEEVIGSISNPNDDALTTDYEYYEDAGNIGSYGRIKKITGPDGSWTEYSYDEHGRTLTTTTPWLDNGTRSVVYDYEPVSTEDSESVDHFNDPRTITEKINGQAVSTTYYVYISETDAEIVITEQCPQPGASYGTGNLRTVRYYHPSGLQRISGRLQQVVYPDGRQDTHAYEYDGNVERHTVTHGTSIQPDGIAYKTMQEVTITDSLGRTVRQETRVFTGGTNYDLIDWTEYEYNINDHLVATIRSDGTRTDADWGCCNRDWEKDAQGIEREYVHDALNRITSMTKVGTVDQPTITTSYTYDAAGRRLTETVNADTLIITSSMGYDLSGRIISQTDASGLTTTYDYFNGGRTTTVNRPIGTETTERYLDGRIKSVTGTSVIPRYYTYGVYADGTQWTEVHIGEENSQLWERTTTDALGRTIKSEKPGFTGDIEITQNFYNNLGQLERVTMPGQADTYYIYNSLGEQSMTGLDVDGYGLDPNSIDRVTSSETAYVEENGLIWRETVQSVYAEDNDDTPTVVSTQRTQVTGLGNGLVNRSESIDIHGNTTVSSATVDRTQKMQTQSIDYPDSDTDAVSVNVNGLLVSSVSKTGLATTYDYDALGRRTSVTDSRTSTFTNYNDQHRVGYVEDADDNRITFAYDQVTGRKVSETNADNKTTYYTYNDRGQVTQTWGEAVYPVKYVYDGYGRMTEMHTFRTGTAWNSSTWPVGEDADITIWTYDPATGLLTKKTDDQNNFVTYTYDAAGRLKTRIWARVDNNSDPIVTAYNYNTNTGELIGIDYSSDDTTSIGFVYDRLGRQKTITDAVGTRTFAYNNTLQLDSETITGLYGPDDKIITRTYAQAGLVGRNTGFTVDAGYTMTYGYDNKGRFNTAGWNINDQADTAAYTYLTNADLLAGYSTTSGQNVSYGYEDHRNLKTLVESAFNSAVVSNYAYQYDSLGRRENVVNTGQAFSQDAFNVYNYNERSELTNSDRFLGTDVTDLSTPVDPEKRLYSYDPIGNRQTATEGAQETIYTANSLNQYTAVDSSSLTYDDDGNLTDMPSSVIPAEAGIQSTTGWNLTWNAENRLISVAPQTLAIGDTKVEFVYDYRGRRVSKILSEFNGTDWTETSTTLYIYDGWNLIQELDGTGAFQKSYAWGLDLSQSLQGAGGVGGLLAMTDGTDTYLYCYDANGNVGQMVDASNGSLVANYQYDPFGNLIHKSGDLANANPFRFSTKYSDSETGLYYYGYRYYLSELGRWLNRDPIGEAGGENLYGFVWNNPINYFDYLGYVWSTASGMKAIEMAVKIKNGTSVSAADLNKCCAGDVRLQMPRVKDANCIQFALTVITCAYRLNNDDTTADDITNKAISSGWRGSSVGKYMVDNLGWQPIYYDRDFTTHKHPWDNAYRALMSGVQNIGVTREDLAFIARRISGGKSAFGLNPVGAVTDFAPFSIASSFTLPGSYQKLTQMDFVYGIAHYGFHNYIMSKDKVYEGPGHPDTPDITSGFNNWIPHLYGNAQGILLLPPLETVPSEMSDNLTRLRGITVPDGVAP